MKLLFKLNNIKHEHSSNLAIIMKFYIVQYNNVDLNIVVASSIYEASERAYASFVSTHPKRHLYKSKPFKY